MKLIINYDLIDAVRNVNEPLSPLKVVRNSKTQLAFGTVLCFCGNNIVFGNSVSESIGQLFFQIPFYTGWMLCIEKFLDDTYFDESSDNLKKLSSQLNDFCISTNYDLLLESKVYDKKYEVKLNEKKIPLINEEKYILVPTYNYNRNVKDTSILQEHVVGSKEYVLSLGSPKKEHKLAHSNV